MFKIPIVGSIKVYIHIMLV